MSGQTLDYRATFTRVLAAPSLAERHRVWHQTTLALGLLLAVCVALALVDERTLLGVSVWSKPIKFSLSLAVYFATMAWFAPLLPDGYFETWRGRALTWVPVVCGVAEMVYIVAQAARGEASHFNTSTSFQATMYSLMGAGAVALVSATLWMGCAILHRHRLRDPLALAVGLGFVATFVLGGGFGGYLGGQSAHWVGGTASDAGGMALFKWSRDGGDLRVAHFFGMHAMQVLPLLALLLPRRLPRVTANGIIIAITLVYAAFSAWTFVQAVAGQPFPV